MYSVVYIAYVTYKFLHFSTDVRRHDGHFKGYMNYLSREDVLPMTYTILEAYVRTTFPTFPTRDLDIVCTLRGGGADPVRQRVKEWVGEYGKMRGISNIIAGEVNHASRYECMCSDDDNVCIYYMVYAQLIFI